MEANKPASNIAAALRSIETAHRSFHPLPPLDYLLWATLSSGSDDAEASAALKNLSLAFVDWNEARVARVSELVSAAAGLPDVEARVLRMREMLNRLFDLRGAIDILFLQDIKPAEAKRCLIDLDSDLPRPIMAMVLFALCPGATLPLSNEALRVARKRGLVSRSSGKQALQKSLLAELSSQDAARLVQYLEWEATGLRVGAIANKPNDRKKKPAAKKTPRAAKKR